MVTVDRDSQPSVCSIQTAALGMSDLKDNILYHIILYHTQEIQNRLPISAWFNSICGYEKSQAR